MNTTRIQQLFNQNITERPHENSMREMQAKPFRYKVKEGSPKCGPKQTSSDNDLDYTIDDPGTDDLLRPNMGRANFTIRTSKLSPKLKHSSPQSSSTEKVGKAKCSCINCKPCTKKSEPCRWCQFGRAENKLLLKKLEGYEKPHVPMRQRNDDFCLNLLIFAFFYWLTAQLFAQQTFCLIGSWAMLSLTCYFNMVVIDQEYSERGVKPFFIANLHTGLHKSIIREEPLLGWARVVTRPGGDEQERQCVGEVATVACLPVARRFRVSSSNVPPSSPLIASPTHQAGGVHRTRYSQDISTYVKGAHGVGSQG
ncbi:hypothetical protein EK21DRAFT_86241 [Setomelanomma holmii]|uniref:Uncharacterized protein n=1 Tax=Setomelanomma holmii TaxID=210430 RepID=A0A9P4HI38_9PLEO|nr:hypothetical protein EK21DRAFT_86241 [Setomelanomma holmii]